jgi:hypothetical protein
MHFLLSFLTAFAINPEHMLWWYRHGRSLYLGMLILLGYHHVASSGLKGASTRS